MIQQKHRGAQHKLAGLTGAGYRLDSVVPFRRAVGTDPAYGRARVVVTKDRPGHVRGVATEGVMGTLAFTAWPDGRVSLELEPVGEEATESPLDRKLVGAIIEYLGVYDGATTRAISQGVEGRHEAIRETLRRMVEMGLVVVRKVGAAHYHDLTDLGREWS